MDSISTLLEERLEAKGVATSVTASMVCESFVAVMQELNEVAALKVEPLYVKRNILYVSVPSSSWANEIFMMRNEIVAGVNKKVGKEVIAKVMYRLRS